MKLQTSFQRKIAYLVALVGLLFGLYMLGSPATNQGDPTKGSPGGILARIRSDPEVGLSQVHLGEFDPTSEALKLATFGLRGVATNLLWQKAHRFKMKKDWNNLAATVEQITKLEPHFISVWIFQAWNQSYNVSKEFDDVRRRYEWVIDGIRFLQKGAEYNARRPRLPWEIGWVTSHKIGRADEHRQFRKMFREDKQFHDSLPKDFRVPGDDPRDNWLVAKAWYRKAEAVADTVGGKMTGKGPLIYRSNAPMCQMSYAEALENDGVFGERAKMAWRTALQEWLQYGTVDLPTGPNAKLQLNALERHEKAANDLAKKIDALAPGLRKQLETEKLDKLTHQQRAALDAAPQERDLTQLTLANEAQRMIRVTELEVAAKVPQDHRGKAVKMAREAAVHRATARLIGIRRHVVNYDYWRLRATMEQLDDVVGAHELFHKAEQVFEEQGELTIARQKYEQAFVKLHRVLQDDRFRSMIDDATFGGDMREVVERYERILELDDKGIPKDGPTAEFVSWFRREKP